MAKKKVKLKDNDFFNEKKLNTIMKRFLNTKKTDPEETKWYYVENNVNFYATSLGASIEIAFQNRFENSYNKGDGENFFVQPAKETIVADYIPEMVEVGKGKNKETLPTGHSIPFPDVKGLFKKYDPKNYKRILVDEDFISEMISFHESLVSFLKLGGNYATAKISANGNKLIFGVHDIKGMKNFKYEYEFKGDCFEVETEPFYYNPEYVVAILKALKDLKVNKTIMYFNAKDPILFYGKTIDYIYKFAFNKKLVR